MNQKDYFNNKYPKKTVVYNGRHVYADKKWLPVTMDVRSFIWPNDAYIESRVNDALGYDHAKIGNDDKALNLLKWIIENVEYVGDETSNYFVENWLLPQELLARNVYKGDCEDGAMALASMMINSGIPNWRVKVAAGWVKEDGKRFGHCWVLYRRELDNEVVALDWCYYPSLVPVRERDLYKEIPHYDEIWWTFNDEFSWAQRDVEIEGRVNKV